MEKGTRAEAWKIRAFWICFSNEFSETKLWKFKKFIQRKKSHFHFPIKSNSEIKSFCSIYIYCQSRTIIYTICYWENEAFTDMMENFALFEMYANPDFFAVFVCLLFWGWGGKEPSLVCGFRSFVKPFLCYIIHRKTNAKKNYWIIQIPTMMLSSYSTSKNFFFMPAYCQVFVISRSQRKNKKNCLKRVTLLMKSL
jgi:hypothetical protein